MQSEVKVPSARMGHLVPRTCHPDTSRIHRERELLSSESTNLAHHMLSNGFGFALMRLAFVVACSLLSLCPLHSATLERLTLDDMILQSTEIVRGRVISSRSVMRGPVVYTLVQVQVDESWKGSRNGRVEVAIPGGTFGKLRQSFSGAPSLEQGPDYLLYLWTGRSGGTQVIGLSQGLFVITRNKSGQTVASRPASTEQVLDPKTGQEVLDAAITMRLDAMRGRVDRLLSRSSR